MAFGFQINDALGNKVLDDSMLVGHVLSIVNISAASGSMYIPESVGVDNVAVLLFDDDFISNQFNLWWSGYGTTANSGNIVFDAVTNTISWSLANPPSKAILVGSGDAPDAYGISINNAFGSTVISPRRKTMAFIGKATYVGYTQKSGSRPYAGGYYSLTVPNIPTYRITAPAGVTDVMPMIYSTIGGNIVDITKSGNVFTILCNTDSAISATIYCFADATQVGMPPSSPSGIDIFDDTGLKIFTSYLGRSMLRGIEVVNVDHNVAFNTGSVQFAHTSKIKPIYGFHASGGLVSGSLYGYQYTIKTVNNTTGKGVMPSYNNHIRRVTPSASTVLIADGADYD